MLRNSSKAVGGEDGQSWFTAGGSSGEPWRRTLLCTRITTWVVLCIVVCGCATKEKSRDGSAQDARIAQIVKEEGARIAKENLAHAQLVKEQEKKIRTQMPIR